ncbi:hypothetical protein WA158_006109 [Blastocystis sp. Blastoise]
MFANIGEKLKKIDVYRSTQDDFTVKTMSGAIISIISVTLMIVLFSTEFIATIRPEQYEKLVVDKTLDQPMDVHFDVNFPLIPCSLLAVGARDALGEDRRDIITNIFKQDLDINGNLIGNENKDELVHTAVTKEELLAEEKNSTQCLPCYGADDVVTRASPDAPACCNTCEILMDAYKKKMWSLDKIMKTPVCKDFDGFKNWKEGVEKGCHIYGSINVNKVGGHIFLAPSKAYTLMRERNLDWNTMQRVYNVSHTINSVTFGPKYPGRTSPLDNRSFTMNDTTGMYQYFVKVVPTTYKVGKQSLDTYQISETHHFRQMTDKSSFLFPGLFFVYDISPLRSIVTVETKPVGAFFTSVCAILGGIFSMMGLLDSIIYEFTKKINNKSSVLDNKKPLIPIPTAKRD